MAPYLPRGLPQFSAFWGSAAGKETDRPSKGAPLPRGPAAAALVPTLGEPDPQGRGDWVGLRVRQVGGTFLNAGRGCPPHGPWAHAVRRGL